MHGKSDDADDTDDAIVVLESFEPPHERTHPYLVQLVDSLPPSVQPVYFSWRRALLGRFDMFHVHWPEVFVRGGGRVRGAARALLYVALLVRLRLQRRALVRTLHNLAPHEPLSSAFQRLVIRLSDRWTTLWIVLSDLTPPPRPAPRVVAPIGHFRGWFADAPTTEPTPGRILHFGFVRRYKGVESLLQAFGQIGDDGLTLRIVGKVPTAETAAAIERACRADLRISATHQYVPDDQLAREVTESELVVLPFDQITNSSSLILALSLDRPVLLPATPITEQIADEVGHGRVLTYRGPLDAPTLARALDAAKASRQLPPPDLSQRDWPAIGRQHAQAFAWARRLARQGVRPASQAHALLQFQPVGEDA